MKTSILIALLSFNLGPILLADDTSSPLSDPTVMTDPTVATPTDGSSSAPTIPLVQ